jgi:phosphorylcholine metabolism protein LicD
MFDVGMMRTGAMSGDKHLLEDKCPPGWWMKCGDKDTIHYNMAIKLSCQDTKISQHVKNTNKGTEYKLHSNVSFDICIS